MLSRSSPGCPAPPILLHGEEGEKDKKMVNCGSMTFVLRAQRVFPPLSSHESVRYWNAGWFYLKNLYVPNCHDDLPTFTNKPREELPS
jgi:hypothetical protein